MCVCVCVSVCDFRSSQAETNEAGCVLQLLSPSFFSPSCSRSSLTLPLTSSCTVHLLFLHLPLHPVHLSLTLSPSSLVAFSQPLSNSSQPIAHCLISHKHLLLSARTRCAYGPAQEEAAAEERQTDRRTAKGTSKDNIPVFVMAKRPSLSAVSSLSFLSLSLSLSLCLFLYISLSSPSPSLLSCESPLPSLQLSRTTSVASFRTFTLSLCPSLPPSLSLPLSLSLSLS